MTIQDIITAVREDLADENNDSIWSDTQYLRLANEGLRRLDGTDFSFLRRLVDLQPNLIVGETKKYTLPTDFQPKNHFVFLNGIQMERLDENDVNNRRIDNVRFNGQYWFYRENGNWKIELRTEISSNDVFMLLYYKNFDTMVLTPTPSSLELGEMEFVLQNYLKYKFWQKREFFDLANYWFREYEKEVAKMAYYMDRIWKMFKNDYTTIMSDSISIGNSKSMRFGGYCLSASSDGLLTLNNVL